MDLGLTGKIALVTGSSRGIGRGIALALAREGCDLMLTGTDEAALKEAAGAVAALGRKARTLATDLRNPEAPAALMAAVRSGFGRLVRAARKHALRHRDAVTREDLLRLPFVEVHCPPWDCF